MVGPRLGRPRITYLNPSNSGSLNEANLIHRIIRQLDRTLKVNTRSAELLIFTSPRHEALKPLLIP